MAELRPLNEGPLTDSPHESAGDGHESVWGVLGIGLGILILFGALSSLFAKRGGAIDSQVILDECFEPFEIPFGLELRPGGLLPSGAQIAVLAAPGDESAMDLDDESDVEREDTTPVESSADGEGEQESEGESSEPKFDWSTLLAGLPQDSGEPPTRVLIVDYPLGLAPGVHGRHFRMLSWQEPKELEDDGGRTTIDTDRLEWNGLEALYVHTRKFELTDGERRFRDLLRVCLATDDGYRVLYALWPPGATGSLRRITELVAALKPKGPQGDEGAEPD